LAGNSRTAFGIRPLRTQFIEQPLSILKVSGVEALGAPSWKILKNIQMSLRERSDPRCIYCTGRDSYRRSQHLFHERGVQPILTRLKVALVRLPRSEVEHSRKAHRGQLVN